MNLEWKDDLIGERSDFFIDNQKRIDFVEDFGQIPFTFMVRNGTILGAESKYETEVGYLFRLYFKNEEEKMHFIMKWA